VRVQRAARGVAMAVGIAAPVVLIGIACLLSGALASAIVGSPPTTAVGTVGDIPAQYLSAYRTASERFSLGPDGWSYLAAIGKIESDHGRSAAPGVRSGQNSHGCCAGPMQIHNGFGSGSGTWGAYKVDGDSDGRLDVYDTEDSVWTAAHYLRASGAPGDWPRALYAYNHAGWYVERVNAQAAQYRQLVAMRPSPPVAEGWLASVPGFPAQRCDARIVPDVVALVASYGLRLTDCFGGAPHAINGEHPLGLAVDLVPVDGDWRRTERLARAAGWQPSCAADGCGGRGPFRQVLYNGFPGHGDPRYSRQPHLHLSWSHGPASPFTRAPWVRTLLGATSALP
jgi:hypothetical protein